MELKDLLLKKEELPILYHSCFEIPIHPRLLDKTITISQALPHRIFSKVAEEWYGDLEKAAESENAEEREWIKEIFLREAPQVTERFGYQRIENLTWEDNVSYDDNGFASGFSISRNSGGTLYFNAREDNCKDIIPNRMIRFSPEKTKEFEFDDGRVFIYAPHNIDNLPGALFLRNWALAYMN